MRRTSLLVLSVLSLAAVPRPAAQVVPDTLVVAGSSGWPPLSYIDDRGEPAGVLVELWREIGRRTGKTMVFRLTDWQSSLELTRSGAARFHAGMYRTRPREALFDFTPSLRISLPTRPFVSRKLNVDALDDLGSIPLGVVAGAHEDDFIREHHPQLIRQHYATARELFEAALDEEVLAFASDQMIARYMLDQHRAQGRFRILDELFDQPVHAAVPRGAGGMRDWLQAALASLSDRDFERLVYTWAPPAVGPPAWLVPAATSLVGLLLLGFLVQYTLTLRQRARTADLLERRVAQRTLELATANENLKGENLVRRRTEQEKEALIEKLQGALREVRTLTGLLPIRASCKKVRDDGGYWSQLEDYIASHTEAEFSHGLCEDCAEKL